MNRILLMGLGVVGLATGSLSARADAPVPPVSKDDIVLGSDKAPVTVIEYASLTCPHCARWETDVFPKVKSDLIDTGKVRYVFRDFPLDGIALKAAELAHCEPSRYLGFIQLLFQTQATWARDPDPVAGLAREAAFGGITRGQLDACLADKKLENAIGLSRQQGEAAGVNSTPTFFFLGKSEKTHAGEIPFEDFEKFIQDSSS
jgi:protein-disulfide isomerase